MIFCAKCGEEIVEGSSFCQSCGAKVEKKVTVEADTKKGLMSRVEQNVYFRIARIFAWFILVVATLALIGSIIYVGPTVLDLLGEKAKVSKREVRAAIDTGIVRLEGELEKRTEKKISPKLLTKLDYEIYGLISLLPGANEGEQEIERLRSLIKDKLAFIDGKIKDQIVTIQEARSIIRDFPENKRLEALENFFEIKVRKQDFIELKKAKAKTKLLGMSWAILSIVGTITMVSMILVLLAIERSIRKTS